MRDGEFGRVLAKGDNGWWTAYVRDAGKQDNVTMIHITVDAPWGEAFNLGCSAPAAYAIMRALEKWNEQLEPEQPAGGRGQA